MLERSHATLRQRACAAGPDPARWYPVEWDRALARGAVQEVTFWGTSVALYRDQLGGVHAVENRCAHRQVKLSHGRVDGCQLRCIYHGWGYGPTGKLESIPHELFGARFPAVELRTYPVKIAYGLIWLFFGDPALAAGREPPRIPELEGDQPWVCVPTDYIWRAHPTMIVNNVMDSTHVGTLHNARFQTRSFTYGRLISCESDDDRVLVRHEIEQDPTGLLAYIGPRLKVKTQDACYEYPHLWVSVGGVYKLWNLLLPIDARRTRIFLLSLTERVKIPFTPWGAPRWLDRLIVPVAERLLVRTLFEEDGWSTALEQEGHDAHGERAAIDPHPAVRQSYQLTVRKWEEHLARHQARRSAAT